MTKQSIKKTIPMSKNQIHWHRKPKRQWKYLNNQNQNHCEIDHQYIPKLIDIYNKLSP
jgi:hypothetical protein